MRPTRIPLFPLEVVLFPGMPLPLHIFEPRYRTMIARCVNEKIEFGVILATGTEIAKIGCSAEIVEKLKEYPDGRVDILCEGRVLFRPIEVLHEKEYQEAIADYLPEDIPLQDPEKESQLLERFQVCHALVFGQPWIVSSRDDELSLAFDGDDLDSDNMAANYIGKHDIDNNASSGGLVYLYWGPEDLEFPQPLAATLVVDRNGSSGTMDVQFASGPQGGSTVETVKGSWRR